MLVWQFADIQLIVFLITIYFRSIDTTIIPTNGQLPISDDFSFPASMPTKDGTRSDKRQKLWQLKFAFGILCVPRSPLAY
jgi:hypothetical protein